MWRSITGTNSGASSDSSPSAFKSGRQATDAMGAPDVRRTRTTKANPSRGGDAKSRDPSGRPGYRKGCSARVTGLQDTALRTNGGLRAARDRFGGHPAAGHLRVAIDSAAHTADFSTPLPAATSSILQEWEQPRLRSLKAANPGAQGPDVQGPVGNLDHPGRLHGHRRVEGGDGGAPRMAPEEHERPGLHVPRLQLPVGGRHRPALVPGPLGRQRADQAPERRLGRRLRRRHEPDDQVPLSRRLGGQVPVRRRLRRRHRFGPFHHRPAPRGRGHARDPELR